MSNGISILQFYIGPAGIIVANSIARFSLCRARFWAVRGIRDVKARLDEKG